MDFTRSIQCEKSKPGEEEREALNVSFQCFHKTMYLFDTSECMM